MTSERWNQIKTIYYKTVETAPDKRAALLGEVCGDDADLRGEIESMLLFEEKSADIFEKPVFNIAVKLLAKDDNLPPLERIDNYRIVREIGRGGMGVVYLAERIDGLFEQKTALKIIKRGMDTDAILKRFTNERQILASLDHTNIARLFDGGTTADGLPYFVMEYIDGLPVDRFCDEKNLNLTERLKLFRKICDAISYAHQNLIIHRDLKPSNILVTEKSEPKLLDFGIAKLLHAKSEGETELTEIGKRMLTPEYASPEQIGGTRATTQSDVFSLGVLLSKLIKSSKSDEFKIAKSNADLEAILQTAVHPEIERRYSSVEQFGEDIRRFLDGLPVLARKDSFAYRLAKFVYRNQSAVFASAFLILALIAATFFSVRQARLASEAQERAERRFKDVRKLANNVLFDYHDKIENLTGATEVRQKMLKDSLEYLDGLLREAGNDAGLLSEIGAAYLKIGDVQGKPFAANAGDTNAALESYSKAGQIFLELSRREAENRDFQINLSRAWNGIGRIQMRRLEIDESIESHRKGPADREKLSGENPTDISLRGLFAESLLNLGDALATQSNLISGKNNAEAEKLNLEALELARRSLQIRLSIVAENQTVETLREAATAFQRIGFRLESIGENKHDAAMSREALENHQAALRHLETAQKIAPDNAKIQRNYADELMVTADVLVKLNDFSTARQNYQQAQKKFEEIAAIDPTNVEAGRDLVNIFDRWGRFYVALKNPSKAIENYRKAERILSEIYRTNPTGSDKTQLEGLEWWIANAESHIARQPK